MVIREKKKIDMYKKAVDVDAIPIIIEDNSAYDKYGNNVQTSSSTRDTVTQVQLVQMINGL